jgi:hypothetical protein
MAEKRLKRPRDPIQLAKLVGDIATGEVHDARDDGKSAAAAELGRKGGTARREKLTAGRRSEIAKGAAQNRWSKKRGKAEVAD